MSIVDEDIKDHLSDVSSLSDSPRKIIQISIKLSKEEEYLKGNEVLCDKDDILNVPNEVDRFNVPDDGENDRLECLSSIDFSSSIDYRDVENLTEDSGSVFSINKFISSLPIDDEIFFAHLPPINRDPKATIPSQIFKEDFEDKLVYISEVFDAAHFWFQFVVGNENYENFDEFHTKINNDYINLLENEMVIADENFHEGFIVAAYVKNFKKWYRARIVNNYKGEKNYVRLYFIDYGTNGNIDKSDIRYLFKSYLNYPSYCYRGRLHGIVPLNNARHFKTTHTEEFLKKISNYVSYATLIKYEADDDVYQIKLIRRKGNVNMLDYMIENKMGQRMAPWDNDGEFSIGPPSYLIPSFKSLENDYPSFAELDTMQRSEMDIDSIIDSNYLHCFHRKDIQEKDNLRMLIDRSQFKKIKKYFFGYN